MFTCTPIGLTLNTDGGWDLEFQAAVGDPQPGDATSISLVLTFSDPEAAQADFLLGEAYDMKFVPSSSHSVGPSPTAQAQGGIIAPGQPPIIS